MGPSPKFAATPCEPFDKEMALHHEVQHEAGQPLESHAGTHSKDDRKMLLKMDVLLIPIVAMLYLLVFIDRANIGNARVAGLQKGLELTDLQYKTGRLLLGQLFQ